MMKILFKLCLVLDLVVDRLFIMICIFIVFVILNLVKT